MTTSNVLECLSTENLDDLLLVEDAEFSEFDDNRPVRHRNLVRELQARESRPETTSGDIPPRYILEQAADRYFMLIQETEASLKGRFTKDETTLILSTTCDVMWDWNTSTSVATMVADDNGIEGWDELESGSTLHTLLTKLTQLSQIENTTLVDACERFWRGKPSSLF